MAVQIVFLVSFFGITNYNDNNNIKPLVVKSPPRRSSSIGDVAIFVVRILYLKILSLDSISGISRYKFRSSTIEVVPSDLDSSNRTAFLVWASYHARMHREERRPSHRSICG